MRRRFVSRIFRNAPFCHKVRPARDTREERKKQYVVFSFVSCVSRADKVVENDISIALTGFMGVGKSSVSRHLANMLKIKRVDLDTFIEQQERRKIADIIDADGVTRYREIETVNLKKLLENNDARILSLGGGTWTIPANRELIKSHDFITVWLEATFEHCWLNIKCSRKERPLARDKKKARELFEDRQKIYCLADWHFVIRAGNTSYDIARQIADEIFL
jgi:shikimate kinase